MTNREVLATKMKIRPEMTVLVVNAPEHVYISDQAVSCVSTPPETGQRTFLAGLLFTRTAAELEKFASPFFRSIERNGLIWVAYPKKTSPLHSDIHRDKGWEPVYELGIRPIAQLKVDDDWSAIRFRPGQKPDRAKKDLPQLIVPNDLTIALDKARLTTSFTALAYTHRKEHINLIDGAKKAETRLRRIERTIEMLANSKTKSEYITRHLS